MRRVVRIRQFTHSALLVVRLKKQNRSRLREDDADDADDADVAAGPVILPKCVSDGSFATPIGGAIIKRSNVLLHPGANPTPRGNFPKIPTSAPRAFDCHSFPRVAKNLRNYPIVWLWSSRDGKKTETGEPKFEIWRNRTTR